MNDAEEPQKINVQELFVTLGRLEGKVDGLSGIPERLGKVEILAATTAAAVDHLNSNQATTASRRPQWPSIVGAIVAVITGVSVIVGLFVTLNSIASAISAVTP